MRIRVFTTDRDPLEKLLNLLKHQSSGGLSVLFCSPEQWLPPAAVDASTVADLHIYVGSPVRLAVPWARYNLLVGATDAAVPDDMDRIEPAENLEGASKQILATLREWLRVAAARAHEPALPVAPPKGTVPPKVAILTATGGRGRAWWGNMVQNVTGQAWPVSRLEWCIVDDEGDDNLADLVEELREKTPSLIVRYKSVRPGTSVGAKWNRAAALASADVSVFAIMEDDDHYPANSVSTRVSWLSRQRPTEAVYCATLPVYDVRRYVSAIHVPPLAGSVEVRTSPSSLVFTRGLWTERPFSDGDGTGFLEGRLDRTVEIGPADVLVSLMHPSMSSVKSSIVLPAQEPNGCHFGFSDAYFQYLHGLVAPEEGPAQSSTESDLATS